MKVYILNHARDLGDDVSENKIIGIYSTEENAEKAIERLRTQPGFKNFPDDFEIGEFVLDSDTWTEGFNIG